MKILSKIFLCLISGLILFFLCYDYSKKIYPREYYNVYLDGELLGTIKSKSELNSYINSKTNHVINNLEETKEYCNLEDESTKNLINSATKIEYYDKGDVKCASITTNVGTYIDDVYQPEGLNIEKTLTYKNDLSTSENIYNKIVTKKSLTVKGYKFTIKNDDKTTYIYVTDKDIFEKAIKELIKIYVGEDSYNEYINKSQTEIKTTGSKIENIYIGDDISVKEDLIPLTEKIYTDYKNLSQFLLYGSDPITSNYTVKEGEMIDQIAFNNEISINEFIISNTKYKNENSLITPGTQVKIKETNPQLRVVVESYVVKDMNAEYETIYQYDDSQYIGYQKTIQEGDNGLVRVKQTEQVINGVTTYVEPKGKETLKATIDKIIVKGEKFVPNVGDLNNWGWPTDSGWTISDNYGWRIHPITGVRQFHAAIDIAGNGYGAKIYAANNGTVLYMKYDSGYGYHVVINHNNGYYTVYAHMSKFASNISVGSTVSRGQVIGYVGTSGSATGPHVHYEIWKGCEYCRISPWTFYK